eukprot:6801087-Prymnesium_polylepis.2
MEQCARNGMRCRWPARCESKRSHDAEQTTIVRSKRPHNARCSRWPKSCGANKLCGANDNHVHDDHMHKAEHCARTHIGPPHSLRFAETGKNL